MIAFSTGVQSLGVFKGTPSGKSSGKSKVKRLQAFGGTNINNALLKSLKGASSFKRHDGIKQVRNIMVF